MKSELWKRITEKYEKDFDVETFRNPSKDSINSRFASWAPTETSLRWYKSFLFNVANTTPTEELVLYSSIDRTDLGNPISVTIANSDIQGLNLQFLEVNLDYLLAAHETSFLQLNSNMEFQKIVEIGGGFGRTAHAMLEMLPNIELYVVIDLPEVLKMSQLYLKRTLSQENFKKLAFLSSENLSNKYEQFDLSIQIDGFQEMTSETVDRYYEEVIATSKYFFSVNPIGKYLPSTAGIEVSQESKIAMELGRSRDIVDIWDVRDMQKIREKHVANYSPILSSVVLSAPSRIFPHYEMTIYRI